MTPPSASVRSPQAPVAMLDTEALRSKPMCVLVVDDAPVLRKAIAQLLTLEGGHTVREAGTHLEAVALLDAVDAVATDGFFPYSAGETTGPWGLALARLARARGKPVILVSADDGLVEQAHWEGIRALSKPAGILQLVAALAEARVSHS
jgi:CheY-like chemotaxis protein